MGPKRWACIPHIGHHRSGHVLSWMLFLICTYAPCLAGGECTSQAICVQRRASPTRTSPMARIWAAYPMWRMRWPAVPRSDMLPPDAVRRSPPWLPPPGCILWCLVSASIVLPTCRATWTRHVPCLPSCRRQQGRSCCQPLLQAFTWMLSKCAILTFLQQSCRLVGASHHCGTIL